VSETHCPFCSEALSLSAEPCSRVREPGRLGRAARFAFGAALAGTIAVAGCDDGSEMALYGAPPFDAGRDGGAPPGDGSATDGSAPADGGAADDGGPPADGGVMALYGGPPVDSGSA
jgi:hypothetical protein